MTDSLYCKCWKTAANKSKTIIFACKHRKIMLKCYLGTQEYHLIKSCLCVLHIIVF